MIILDTNVVSEPIKPKCSEAVLEWLNLQIPEELYFTSVGLAEIYYGIAILPEGKRKAYLSQEISEIVEQLFEYRILPFDIDCAVEYANLLAMAKTVGKAISLADAQTAAIAKCHGFAIATRDTKPFIDLGLLVINPWTQATS